MLMNNSFYSKYKKSTSGFSLVEMSIVLVVMGLLVAGAIAGGVAGRRKKTKKDRVSS